MAQMQQKTESKQVPATKEWEIIYKSANIDIRLTPGIVRKFLVRGKGELVSDQEVLFFMKICQARGLNPFIGDAYLIKYGADPAAIITSIDFYRKRAKVQKDCVGWKKGIIVEDGNGQLRDSYGLVKENEKLVGGFFEATPDGWKVPFRLEVNLSGYLRYRKDKEGGEPQLTKFWQPENQPTMISKVAEAQGLRTLWPDEFQGIYTAEETEEADMAKGAIDINSGNTPSSEPTKSFEDLVKGEDITGLDEFLSITAKANKTSIPGLKEAIIKENEFDSFWANFQKWQTRHIKKNQSQKEPEKPEEKYINCPNSPGTQFTEAYCNSRDCRDGCPAF